MSRLLGYEERYFSAAEEERAGRYFSLYVREKAEFEVLAVVGEVCPHLFESDTFKVALNVYLRRQERAIKSGKQPFQVIFNKNLQKLEAENPFLVELAKNGQVSLWLAESRPEQHFFCIDRKSIFVQEEHEPGEPAPTYFAEHTFKLGQQYSALFESLTATATKLYI